MVRSGQACTPMTGEMVNACTPQGEPILGTDVVKKNDIIYIVLNKLSSHLAEIVRRKKKENSPLLVEFRFLQPSPQTLVSRESVGLVIPRVLPPSQRSVWNFMEQMDSKVLTNKVGPRFHSSCLCEGSGPIVPMMKNFTTLAGAVKVSEKGRQVHKLVFFRFFWVQGTMASSAANHC